CGVAGTGREGGKRHSSIPLVLKNARKRPKRRRQHTKEVRSPSVTAPPTLADLGISKKESAKKRMADGGCQEERYGKSSHTFPHPPRRRSVPHPTPSVFKILGIRFSGSLEPEARLRTALGTTARPHSDRLFHT